MAKSETPNIYDVLSNVDLSEKVENKGNVQYLSWGNAWDLLKKNYPAAQRKVYENPLTGLNYFTDGNSAYVKVGIIIDDLEHIDYLPVMDFRNNSVKLDKITSVDINKSIQRSTAKAIAMHGLGIALWMGEDIPTHVPETTPQTTPKAQSDLPELTKDSEDWTKVTNYVRENFKNGIEKIGKQLNRRYKMNAATKKLIAAIIKEQEELANKGEAKEEAKND